MENSATKEEEPPATEEEKPPAPEPQQQGMIVKPSCECCACDSWAKSADWCPPTTLKFVECTNKRPKEKQVKPLMRSEKHPGKAPQIRSHNPKNLTRIEKQLVFNTVVHGEVIPEPVNACTETYFSQNIQRSLESLNYRYSVPVQSFAWPAIFRQMNVFVIGSHQCGKTLSYLPALCTFATSNEERYEELGKYKGPLVVIVCSNSKQCEEVFDLSKKILDQNAQRLKLSIVTYPVPNAHSTDILITIPESLIHCLKARVFNLKRLCHLVLEDASTLLANHETAIYKVLQVVDEMLEHRTTNTKVQLIVTSEKWTSDLKKLLKSVYTTPLVCIGNHLEAGLYGKIQFEFKFLSAARKLDYLESVLKDKYYDYKTIVICDQPEITEVSKWLAKKGIQTLALSNETGKEDIEYTEIEWNFTDSGRHKVLLCTDLVFESHLCINSAMWLVNFSFPSTWTAFTKRFRALSAYYKSPLDSGKDGVRCKSFVLIDDTCDKEMPRIANLLNRLSSNSQQFAEGVRERAENEKIANEVELCSTLKMLGRCQHSLCEKRHLLSPQCDVSDDLPKSGKIKFRILHMKDVTQFSVQLLQHIDLEGNVTQISEQDVRQPLDYDENSKKLRAANLVVGKFYAHRESTTDGDVYMLCQVISMGTNQVEVKLQSGLAMQTTKNRLYSLPKSLKIVDVFLSNLVPPFQDSFFSGRSFHAALTALQNKDYRKTTWTGRVNLQLDGNLWLDEVVEMFTVDGTDVIRFNMIKHLLKLQVVEAAPSRISSLYKLCRKSEIALPGCVKRKSANKAAKSADVEPQWAWLNENIHEVILSCAYSPDEFYVRLWKFSDLLENLHKDIDRAVNNEVLDKNLKVEIGRYYLAPDRQGIYSRVKVLNVEDNKVLCFHVDYGDECVVDISTLKILPSKLLTRLPFQAIQCRLWGLHPAFGEWDGESTDILYKYMYRPESDIFRELYVDMRDKGDDPVKRTNVKYSVVLKDGHDERQMVINQLLLDCGLATSMFDSIDDFEIPQAPVVEESSEEELDVVKGPGVDEDSDGEELGPCIDLEIFNPETFLQMLTGLTMDEIRMKMIKEEGEEQKGRVSPSNCATKTKKEEGPVEETSDGKRPYLTPEIIWTQTEKTIQLKIKLVGVGEYKINVVLKKIFTFSATVDDRPYYVKFTLHDRVTLDRHRASGQEVVVTLNKLEAGEWPQLTNAARRMRNVHYDVPEEKDAPRKKFLQLDISDDESDSDDNFMYVDVDTDEDSEYEMEQPDSSDDDSF